jgi:CHAD domain-containing protein
VSSHAREPSDIIVPKVGRSSTTGEVIEWTIASSTHRLLAHENAVQRGVDLEGVHQARVATRRLRSDLRTFGAMIDARRRDDLRRDLRWLGARLGAVRDLDVLQERLRTHGTMLADADRSGLAAVLDQARAQREPARQALLSTMRGSRYADLIEALYDALARSIVRDEVANAPAVRIMGGAMAPPWSKLKKSCDDLEPGSPDADLHVARIRAKHVRYAADSLAPVFGKPARRLARRAEALQEVLGRHQDAVVAISWLCEQTERSAPTMAAAAAMLVGIEVTIRDDARHDWSAVWAELRSKELRFWV